jgi:hypothetical protein
MGKNTLLGFSGLGWLGAGVTDGFEPSAGFDVSLEMSFAAGASDFLSAALTSGLDVGLVSDIAFTLGVAAVAAGSDLGPLSLGAASFGAVSGLAADAADTVASFVVFAAAEGVTVSLVATSLGAGEVSLTDFEALVVSAAVLGLAAATDAREAAFCVGLSPSVLGVFAFATLKTFPILTYRQLFFQS